MVFVDTNVLLYAVGVGMGFDERAMRKGPIARDAMRRPDLALSVQVLQEFYTQAIKENKQGKLSHTEAIRYTDQFKKLPVQSITLEIFQAALTTKHRYQINYWDAAIIEAARALRCDTILSEDLNHGQDFGGVHVVNPFLEA